MNLTRSKLRGITLALVNYANKKENNYLPVHISFRHDIFLIIPFTRAFKKAKLPIFREDRRGKIFLAMSILF